MRYKIELKSVFINDETGRGPTLDTLKNSIKAYCKNHKGYIIKHDSFYDYRYDTMQSGYPVVDERKIYGTAIGVKIENNKVFVDIEIGDNIEIPDKIILFYRAKMSSSNIYGVLDKLEIIAIDLIEVRPSDKIPDENLSTIITE